MQIPRTSLCSLSICPEITPIQLLTQISKSTITIRFIQFLPKISFLLHAAVYFIEKCDKFRTTGAHFFLQLSTVSSYANAHTIFPRRTLSFFHFVFISHPPPDSEFVSVSEHHHEHSIYTGKTKHPLSLKTVDCHCRGASL